MLSLQHLLSIIFIMNNINKLLEFLKTSPNDCFLSHALALEYIKQQDDAKAKELFINILTNTPNYIGSYYHLAKLLERNNDTEKAIFWYEQGMQQAKLAKDNHAYNELQMAYEDLVY